MKSRLLIALLLLVMAAGAAAGESHPDGAAVSTGVAALLQGRFDNREQAAQASTGAEPAIPKVTVTIEPTPQKDWALWRVRVETDADSTYEQTWAMQTRVEHDGSRSLVPYYQYKQATAPAAAEFKADEWLSLEACALRGTFTGTRIEAMSEGEPCVAVTMSVGARRALMPVGIVREGDWLHVDLNLRGARTRIEAKRAAA